jgi:phosphatidylglycerophosphate synthase
LARRGLADHLWARILAGAPVAGPTALAILLVGGGADILDGALARSTQRQTRLGAYLDATADAEFWLALAATLTLTRRLPAWLGALLAARFFAPFAAALAAYFGLLARLPLGSTGVGKAAGVAQALVVAEASAPQSLRQRTAPLRPALRAGAAVLLLLAPLSQVARLRRLRLP